MTYVYLNMECIPSADALFAVCCQYRYDMQGPLHEATCGLYSFANEAWTDLPSVPSEADSCKTLFDGNDAVYLWNTDALRPRFYPTCYRMNLSRGQWLKTSIDLPLERYGVWKGWIEDGHAMRILAAGMLNDDDPDLQLDVWSLDLRSNGQQWRQESVDMRGMPHINGRLEL